MEINMKVISLKINIMEMGAYIMLAINIHIKDNETMGKNMDMELKITWTDRNIVGNFKMIWDMETEK